MLMRSANFGKSRVSISNKHLSFMCGGGWRAAEVLTFAHVIGVSNTSLYSDGWIGWSSDRRNAVETGPITVGTDSR
jgi:3-mercaptopyruvate sulfurtransferase SseA